VARFVAQLLHDVLKLGFDHRRRDREIMLFGELVEQPPLHVGARQAVQLLLDLAADQPAQLLEALQPERLGELLVDLGFAGGLHRLDGHREARRLALELGGLIIGRELDLDVPLLAGLGADQPLLEARDHPV
jgi:hypothetical protein